MPDLDTRPQFNNLKVKNRSVCNYRLQSILHIAESIDTKHQHNTVPMMRASEGPMIKFLFAAAVGLFLSVGPTSAAFVKIQYTFTGDLPTRTSNPLPDNPELAPIFSILENNFLYAHIYLSLIKNADDSINAYGEFARGGNIPVNGAVSVGASHTSSATDPELVFYSLGGQISILDDLLGNIQVNGTLRTLVRPWRPEIDDSIIYGGFSYFDDDTIAWGIEGYGMLYEVKGSWTKIEELIIPLPASLPLLLGGIATLTALRYRGRKTAAA